MNNTPATSASDAVRTRRLLILGVLLLLAAVAVTVGRVVHSRMQQAALTQDRPKDLQYGVSVYNPATASEVQTKRQGYLAKANLLRDHWRVWAVAHQGLLRQLRQAPSGDTATLMRVYSALPSLTDKSAGVTIEDVRVDQDDFNAGRGVLFTWQAKGLGSRVSEGMLQSDPQAQAKNDQSNVAYHKKLQHDFDTYHDIMLSESMSAGRSRITLWADGRITEMVLQRQHTVGQPIYVDGPEKELVPAYDFLK